MTWKQCYSIKTKDSNRKCREWSDREWVRKNGRKGGREKEKGEKKREWGIGFPLTVCLGSSTCSSLKSSHCGTSSTPGCLFLLLGPTCCGLVEARKTGQVQDHLVSSLSSNKAKEQLQRSPVSAPQNGQHTVLSENLLLMELCIHKTGKCIYRSSMICTNDASALRYFKHKTALNHLLCLHANRGRKP